jgi:hypothetical protein
MRPVAADHVGDGAPYGSLFDARPLRLGGSDGVDIAQAAVRKISSASARSAGYALVNVTVSPVRGWSNDSDRACNHCR